MFFLWDTHKGIPFDESDKGIQAGPQNKLLPLTSATPQNMLCLTTIIREIYGPNLAVIFFENICIILLACISTSPLAYLFTRRVRRKNCSGDDFCMCCFQALFPWLQMNKSILFSLIIGRIFDVKMSFHKLFSIEIFKT